MTKKRELVKNPKFVCNCITKRFDFSLKMKKEKIKAGYKPCKKKHFSSILLIFYSHKMEKKKEKNTKLRHIKSDIDVTICERIFNLLSGFMLLNVTPLAVAAAVTAPAHSSTLPKDCSRVLRLFASKKFIA